MKKLLLLLTLLLTPAAFAQNVAISGNVRSIVGTPSVTNTIVRFRLRNYTGYVPKVLITGVLVQVQKDFLPDNNGNVSGNIYGNDQIDPSGTYYTVEFWYQGRIVFSGDYLIQGTSFNLNTAPVLGQTNNVGPNQLVVQAFPCPQFSPALVWTCTHNFNDKVVWVETFDLNNIQIFPDSLDTSDPNVTTIRWVVPTAGSARILHAGAINIATTQPNAIVQNPLGSQGITGDLTISGNLAVNGILTLTEIAGNVTFDGNVTFLGASKFGVLDLINQASASTPSSGETFLYAKTDKKLYYKDDTGAENGPIVPGVQLNVANTWTAVQTFTCPVPANCPNGAVVVDGSVFPALEITQTGSTSPRASGLLRFLTRDSGGNTQANNIEARTNIGPTGIGSLLFTPADSFSRFVGTVQASFGGAAGNFQSDAANTAQSGTFRCASSEVCVVWRNNANNGDLVLAKNTSDQLTFVGNIVTTINGSFTSGHVATFNSSGQLTDPGITLPTIKSVKQTSLCTTGSSSYDSCTDTLTWPTGGFANTSYAYNCTGQDPNIGNSGEAAVLTVSSYTATTITVRTQTQRSVTAHFTEVSCTGIL